MVAICCHTYQLEMFICTAEAIQVGLTKVFAGMCLIGYDQMIINKVYLKQCLSTYRYLYANCRPIKKNTHTEDQYPELANEVNIHVIDLIAMTQLRILKAGHKGYTQEAVFYLYLDISDTHILR